MTTTPMIRDELKRDIVTVMVGMDRADHPLFLARAEAVLTVLGERLSALTAPAEVAAGMVPVPRELTDAMFTAWLAHLSVSKKPPQADKLLDLAQAAWTAMLAAAPLPEPSAGVECELCEGTGELDAGMRDVPCPRCATPGPPPAADESPSRGGRPMTLREIMEAESPAADDDGTLVEGDGHDALDALPQISDALGCACNLDDILHAIDKLAAKPAAESQGRGAVAWAVVDADGNVTHTIDGKDKPLIRSPGFTARPLTYADTPTPPADAVAELYESCGANQWNWHVGGSEGRDLPVGTKLYTAPPSAPEAVRVVDDAMVERFCDAFYNRFHAGHMQPETARELLTAALAGPVVAGEVELKREPDPIAKLLRNLRQRADSNTSIRDDAWCEGVRFAVNQIEAALVYADTAKGKDNGK